MTARVRFEETLDGVLGFEVLEVGPDRVLAEFDVADRLRQRFGLLHGGAYCTLAELLASEGTVSGVRHDGNVGVGLSNETHFLRPVTDGRIRAEGRPRHRGRTTWVWDVDFTDEQGRLTATARVTIAVRPGGSGAVDELEVPPPGPG